MKRLTNGATDMRALPLHDKKTACALTSIPSPFPFLRAARDVVPALEPVGVLLPLFLTTLLFAPTSAAAALSLCTAEADGAGGMSCDAASSAPNPAGENRHRGFVNWAGAAATCRQTIVRSHPRCTNARVCSHKNRKL